MPDLPQWYQRLPEILQTLHQSTTPYLDRLAVEQLFQVSRRQAIRILSTFGGYQTGRSYLAERTQVIRILEALAHDGKLQQTNARRRRIWTSLRKEQTHLRAKAIPIPASPPSHTLPPGIDLTPGQLRIQFQTPADLLTKLMTLAQSASDDYESFERLCESENSANA